MNEENISQTREEAQLIVALQLAEEELNEFNQRPKPDLPKIKADIIKAREDYKDNPTEDYKQFVMELERDYLDSKILVIGLDKKRKTLEGKVIMAKQRLERYRENH